jgi:fluoride exporter
VSRAPADEIAAVAVGGVIGALARAGISTAVPHHDPASWPWATFITNLVGCVVLGLVLDWVDARHALWALRSPRRARLARPLLASGVLGGFTTFSTFSVETFLMMRAGAAGLGAAYAVSSALLGVGCVVAGRRLGAVSFGAPRYDLGDDEAL